MSGNGQQHNQHHYSSNTSLSSLSAKISGDLDQQQENVTLSSSINLAHKEFNHLPRVNIELVGLAPNKAKLPDNMVVLTQMCMAWLVEELVERKYLQTASAEISGTGSHHQSLTNLCDNLNMLYMNNNDHTLHDCSEMEASDLNFNDHVNDYQKKFHNNNNNNNTCSNGACNTQQPPSSTNGRARFKAFKITDQELNAIGTATPIKLKVLHDNEIICTYQLSESSFVTICTLTGKLITLSVHILPCQYTCHNDEEAVVESRAAENGNSNKNNNSYHSAQNKSVDPESLATLSEQHRNG